MVLIMDSVNSFKGYGKVDEAQDLALKKKTRKRLILLSVFVVILVAVVIAAVVATVVHNKKKNSSESAPSPPSELTPSTTLKTICSVTRFPESCIYSISKLPDSNTTDPTTLFKLSLKVIIDELDSISDLPENLAKGTDDERIKSALRVCGNLIEDALDRLNDTVSAMDASEDGKKKTLTSSRVEDLKTWLSATVTDHETCFDTIDELAGNKTEYRNSTITQNLKSAMSRSTEFTSNSLAIVSKVLAALSDLGFTIHGRRRLLNQQPEWARRRLLQTENLKPDVTVAADGSGDVKTVNEAVAMVPKKSLKVFVIYVKAGTYVENVVMDKSKWNVMIFGDGKSKTIISGGKNFIDGTPTYETATFAIQGKGFIMKDIGIINTAGATKHQAVAFRSGSDFSVYYQCSFDEYKNTGPGSDVTQRVTWAGYKPVMSSDDAARFTVATLLHGGDWIPASGVTHQLS
ncbi:unnamed protein product [Thlaspi arvense]|uniref:Pectinesterase n=1 Tax=Thlaspi arvense TaxID=13288 RepID=A0AAU9RB07_THLAR|nr:unnamed protein product [Thlaspi arvense]